MGLVSEPSRLSDRDDLDEFLDEELQNPEFAAALEDAEERSRLLLELSALRKRAALTQGYVADYMGTSQSAISELERAGTDPRLSTLQRYARAVGARVTFSVGAVVPTVSQFSFTIHRDVEGASRFFHEAVLAASRVFVNTPVPVNPPSYSGDTALDSANDKVEIAA